MEKNYFSAEFITFMNSKIDAVLTAVPKAKIKVFGGMYVEAVKA